MVSRNSRIEGIRKNGSNRSNAGNGSDARSRFDRWRATSGSARPSTRNSLGNGSERSNGSVAVLVAPGDDASERRAYGSPDSSDLGPTVTKNLLISAVSGVGKTRLIREITLAKKERLGGFYTEPLMVGRIQRGFIMRTFDGQERMLAQKGLKSNQLIGKFGVDLNALENVGVPALKLGLMTKELIVIDEIGLLESMSERFKATVVEVLNSPTPVLATIRAGKHAFCDQVRKQSDTTVVVLTRSNFASVKQQVRKWLDGHL
jgi:nucleoside-triphosphatase